MEQDSAGNGGIVVINDTALGSRLHVISDRGQQKKVTRSFDAAGLRGKRVLASVHAQLRAQEGSAFASIKLSVSRASGGADGWDASTSPRVRDVTNQTLQVALDVPDDATSLQVELGVEGGADVWFDPPQVRATRIPKRGVGMTSGRVDALRALARLAGYLRFFHPSDQAASVSWPAFESEAVRRVLAARDVGAIRDVLRSIVASVAPSARIYENAHRPSPMRQVQAAGTRLTRWVRVGSGDSGYPYSAFRTGISEPDSVGITLVKTTPALGCKHATVQLTAEVREGAPRFQLHLFPRRGSGISSSVSKSVPASGSVEGDIPNGVTALMYGVQVGGEGVADLLKIEVTCDGEVLTSFASADAPEIFGAAYHLYSVTKSPACSGCLRVTRAQERTPQANDELDVGIGLGLRLTMPLAVWTDGKHTFPRAPAPQTPAPLPPSDPASRIASAIDIWSTLRWFYPYFDDLDIDWDRALVDALISSERATSASELLAALGTLVAGLRDDHAVVYLPGYNNGLLPLVFHQIGTQLYFVNGIGGYDDIFPRGSVLDAVDGVPVGMFLRQLSSTISAATRSWGEAYLPLVMADGPAGRMISIRAKQPDGTQVTVRVPRLARSKFASQKKERRPPSGTEVAKKIYYLDLSTIDDARLDALLPTLETAQAIICDLRDGASPAAFQILAHAIDHEIRSPYWDTPIASPTVKRYERTQASILPALPRLTGRLVFLVNGRTASSPETILQYARAARLGYIIGEPTGGTNGDTATFDTLGGLRVRFTGLRALDLDGSVIHGRGITPDLVVHPTVDGLRAGRDEILEAAIARSSAP